MSPWSSLERADKITILFFFALTVWTPCGLALAAVSLVNGTHQEWPPDDIRESIGFWTSIAIFVSLFVTTIWLAAGRAMHVHRPAKALPAPLSTDATDYDGV